MPSVYLERNDRNQQIAGVVRQLNPRCQMNEREQLIILYSSEGIRIRRRALEEALGESLPDDEWKQKFAKNVGQVYTYDDREFLIEEYIADDG